MRLLPAVVTASLTLAVAYYVYIPLPDTIQEPWKLMMLDAVFRTTMHLVREEMFYLFINYYYYYLRIHYGACAAMEQVCNSSCDCDDNCVADISKYIIIIMMIIKRCSCMYDQLLKWHWYQARLFTYNTVTHLVPADVYFDPTDISHELHENKHWKC